MEIILSWQGVAQRGSMRVWEAEEFDTVFLIEKYTHWKHTTLLLWQYFETADSETPNDNDQVL